ncbi:chloride intracellular channel protein 3 [Suricata suricatta]|uniref:chloride intracellular channel protein 3 n=1 Tax=Suricata suricatta TaxID=37032 RepID=UPI001155EB0A|nr:chloride intracellular channel protein 3 [Suricata suricatta]
MAETARLQLFVKASEDGESVGHCPSCQRLFMVLLLKGVPFTLTTVDTRRSPDVLKDFAPGSQLPILLHDGEAKTDTLQIEEFLEETLGPPECPSLAPRYRESATAGNDVFHRFSAFIKNPARVFQLLHVVAGAHFLPRRRTNRSPREGPGVPHTCTWSSHVRKTHDAGSLLQGQRRGELGPPRRLATLGVSPQLSL